MHPSSVLVRQIACLNRDGMIRMQSIVLDEIAAAWRGHATLLETCRLNSLTCVTGRLVWPCNEGPDQSSHEGINTKYVEVYYSSRHCVFESHFSLSKLLASGQRL